MWKKVAYYGCMCIIGVVFMIAASVSLVSSRYKKLVNHSIKSGNYSNVLGLYTSYSDKDELSLDITLSDSKSEIHVFESATQRETPYMAGGKMVSKNLLDVEYSIIIVRDKRINSTKQKDGVNYNNFGFVIKNSIGEEFHYYDNKLKNGIISDNDEDKNIYDAYDLKLDTNSALNLFLYQIPYDFLVNYTGFSVYDIEEIRITDSSDNSFATIKSSSPLTYSSETMDKLNELKTYFNDDVINNKSKELKSFYKTWKPEFLALAGCQLALASNKVFTPLFWFKLIGTGILFILFMLVLGDFLVGKRRILGLIQSSKRTSGGGSFTNPSKKNDVKESEVIDITNKEDSSNGKD